MRGGRFEVPRLAAQAETSRPAVIAYTCMQRRIRDSVSTRLFIMSPTWMPLCLTMRTFAATIRINAESLCSSPATSIGWGLKVCLPRLQGSALVAALFMQLLCITAWPAAPQHVSRGINLSNEHTLLRRATQFWLPFSRVKLILFSRMEEASLAQTPALQPPPGVQSNFVDGHSFNPVIVGVIALCITLITALNCIRIVTKFLTTPVFFPEDCQYLASRRKDKS